MFIVTYFTCFEEADNYCINEIRSDRWCNNLNILQVFFTLFLQLLIECRSQSGDFLELI